MAYQVKNSTGKSIWWKDGAWNSGELVKGGVREFPSDHNANVTLFYGGEHGNENLGTAWFPKDGAIEVKGTWRWDTHPEHQW
jgi:hypothetical protein